MDDQALANSIMLRLGCAPIVSQGMCKGETFCAIHGQANDVCWGWADGTACQYVYGLVLAIRNGQPKMAAELLKWSDNA